MNELIAIQKIAGWEKLKTLVLDSVSSPITKRVYNMALDEFLAGSNRRRDPASPRPPSAPGGYPSKRVAWGRRPSLLECRQFVSWRPRPLITVCWRPSWQPASHV